MNAPGASEIIRIIRNEAYYHAREEMRDVHWVEIDEENRKITIGRGTPEGETIQLRDDGTVTINTPNSWIPLLPLGGYQFHHPFNDAYRNISSEVYQHILEYLDQVLGQDVPQTPNKDAHGLVTPGPIKRALEETAVQKALGTALRDILAEIAQGYIKNAGRLGHHHLHQLLGKEAVSRTLRIAGARATIAHFNAITRNTEACEEAHQLNPNATVLHFTLDGFDNPALTGANIIRRAEAAFREQAKRWKTKNTNKDDQKQLWEFFCGLNQTAINKFPPTGQDEYLEICSAGILAGAQPSYSVVRHLVCNWLTRDLIPRNMMASLFQESRKRVNHGKSTQRDLLVQAEAITYCLSRNEWNIEDPEFINITKNLITERSQETENRNEVMSWQEWMDGIPQAVASPKQDAHFIRRNRWLRTARKKSARKDRNTTRIRKETQSETIKRIMRPSHGEAAAQAASEAIRIEIQPGKRVALVQAGQDEPILEITRHNQGRLLANGQGWSGQKYWTERIELSRPDSPAPNPALTTRGLWMEQMGEEASRIISQHPEWRCRWPGKKPDPFQARKEALRQMETAGIPAQTANRDHQLTRELQQTLAEMTNERTWTAARTLHPEVTLHRYNIAQIGLEAIVELSNTNPGALVWTMAYCTPDEDINHPGQVIQMARESMLQAGIDPRHWRYAARMSIAGMQTLTWNIHNEEAAWALGIMAPSGVEPHKLLIQHITNSRTKNSRTNHWNFPENRVEPDTQHAINLLCQASVQAGDDPKAQKNLINQIQDAMDYAENSLERLRATTWSGLLKATERWHRHLNQEWIEQEWRYITNGREQYRWDSAIKKPIQFGDVTSVPLICEEDLYRESLEMEHCVIHYGNKCHTGESRIFSLRTGKDTLGTMELAATPTGWDLVQLRGKHNHPVQDEETIMAAEETRLRYTQASKRKVQEQVSTTA